MIIQCEECQTRFRLADEKIKDTGTKVRCSKCKHVFTVTPPPPEPAEEQVDFGEFNMEQVTDEAADSATDNQQPPPPPGEETPPSTPKEEESTATDNLDFSGLEADMDTNADTGGELADEFSFVDTSQADDDAPEESGDSAEEAFSESFEESPAESTTDESEGFAAAFEESEEAPETTEFGFVEDAVDEPTPTTESFTGEGPSEFSFDEKAAAPDEEESKTEDFAFGDDSESDADAFSFGDDEKTDEAPSFESEESGPSEFSFDEDSSESDSSSEWEESEEGSSFDFDEPEFETESTESTAADGAGDLQFGEIDFADDSSEEPADEGPSFGEDDDFSQASLSREEEPADIAPPAPAPQSPPRRQQDPLDEAPLDAPKQKRKNPFKGVLVLLVLLVLALGGAAAFLYFQEGIVNLNQLAQRFPVLQPYLGQPEAVVEAPRIGISITESVYVDNREAGQLLVIQGEASNNYATSRSAITLKGVLNNEQGETLLQQTVFCGNPLTLQQLGSMPFASIEEAMNNQFGDSLSNMNVTAGASIPFTIVFRNLSGDIATINVEFVDSKPGQ